MKTVIIANPRAAGGRVRHRWIKYNRAIVEVFGPAEVRMTAAPGDATHLVRQSIDEGFERVVVVGGDGSMNEAVNGFFDPESGENIGSDVSLAMFPAGTGGDFARSVGLVGARRRDALRDGEDRYIDVGRAVFDDAGGTPTSRYFINISSFGSSGLIVDKVNRMGKRLGGKLSFMLGTMEGLLAYRNQRVRLRIDDTFEEEMLVNTVAVANGRYFGGSMQVAPQAELDDGQFDVVVIGDIGLGTFVANSRRLYKGTHLGLPEIRMFRGAQVEATPLGDSPVLIDMDGEQPGQLPVRYEILPRVLKVYAPWGRAVAV